MFNNSVRQYLGVEVQAHLSTLESPVIHFTGCHQQSAMKY